MADSWKAMDLNKFVVKDGMIDYVLHKYGSNWQVHDAIADDILDDLLKSEWEKQKHVKCKCKYGSNLQVDDVISLTQFASCSYSVILPIILVVAYVLSVCFMCR